MTRHNIIYEGGNLYAENEGGKFCGKFHMCIAFAKWIRTVLYPKKILLLLCRKEISKLHLIFIAFNFT